MSRGTLVLALALAYSSVGRGAAPDPGPVAPDPGPVVAAVYSAPAPRTVYAAPIPVASYRAPQGHTHTCARGHTWDHALTAGHDCPHCGLPQFVQDASPRPVLVSGSAQTYNTVKPAYYPVQRILAYPAPIGGCANGQCGVLSDGRYRFVPIRR